MIIHVNIKKLSVEHQSRWILRACWKPFWFFLFWKVWLWLPPENTASASLLPSIFSMSCFDGQYSSQNHTGKAFLGTRISTFQRSGGGAKLALGNPMYLEPCRLSQGHKVVKELPIDPSLIFLKNCKERELRILLLDR